MKRFSKKDKTLIREKLTSWFKKNQRNLPWRKNYDPYEIWISEIMLQQTQVATVIPYFQRWIKWMPSIEDVAKADEEAILKLWEGLGYYSRIRNIQRTARILYEKNGGRMYNDYEKILKLPGVGKYTAGAIASIAYNQPKPILDGNVIRVLARLQDFRKNTRIPANILKFWGQAEDLVPENEARYFNQGMMELGALICKPKNPLCDICPIQEKCRSFDKGNQNSLPNRGEKQVKIPIKVSIAVIKKNGKVFIQKRPSHGLMGGLWEFPGGKVEKGETTRKALDREINEEMGVKLKNVKLIKKIKHGYTKYHVDLNCYKADLGKGEIKLKSATQGRWVKIEDLKKYPFPAANTKLIKDL